MSDLKTLEDIPIPNRTFTRRILKAEAVKWVKRWQKQSWTINPEPAEAFVDFFNLTEEDFK